MWKCIFSDQAPHIGIESNRDPGPGEYSRDYDKTLCGCFNVQPGRYYDGGGHPIERPEWQEEELLRELAAWKQRTVNEILAAFAVEVRKPVTIGDLRFDGGWTSLDKMDRAIQFADRLRITERTFYETDETPHVLPIHGEGLTGDSILIAIAMAYDTLDGKMRAMVKQVNDAETIETFSISWE